MPIVGDLLADRYEIAARLGAGGMASVYRAIDHRLQREVALKVLLPNLAADPTLAARFEREARALAAASHPGIVAVFDVEPGDEETGREPFYVMELCDGGSLADQIALDGRVEPASLVPAITAVAEGLAEIHRQGVIHRDVKPHNILFAGDRAKLADFGLARSERPTEQARLTADGTTLGTLPYLAPELLGGAPPTMASDVYALGATAFQALTGRLPRLAGSMSEMVEARLAPPPAASSVAPELGDAFDAPLAAALAVDPTARPTPTAFAEELTSALERWQLLRDAAASTGAKTAAFAVARLGPAPDPPDAASETLAMPIRVPAAEPVTVEPPSADPPSAEPRVAEPPANGSAVAAAARPFAIPGSLLAEGRLRGARLVERAGQAFRGPAQLDAENRRRLAYAGGAIVIVAGVIVVVLALNGPQPGSGAFESDVPVGSPTTSATAATTVTASPGRTPSASPGEAAAAFAALDEVQASITAARGGKDGLTGSAAHDLEGLAANVRSALQNGDYEAAREAADKLASRAATLAENIDKKARGRLLSAIAALKEAIPEG